MKVARVPTGIRAALLVAVTLVAVAQDAAAQVSDAQRVDTTRVVGFEPNQEDRVGVPELEPDRDTRFFAGSSLQVRPRSYYLNRDRNLNQDNIGLSLGGALEWRSGWWLDRLQLRSTLYGSGVIYGPEEFDGTGLFRPGPEGIAVLGELQALVRLAPQTGVRIGRQRFEIPYLGSHDIRMIPNTFEAVALGDISTTVDGLAWIFAYVSRMKPKDSSKFIHTSEAAGVEGRERGVFLSGLQYEYAGGLELSVTNQWSFDIFNTFFAKLERDFPLSSGLTLKGNVQYTDQRAVGDAFVGDFKTNLFAGKLELVTGATTWRVGGSVTGDGSGIKKPYGNPANYLSVIVNDFDRAAETAWLVGVTHDFGAVGPGELSFFTNVVGGNTPETGPAASPDQMEYDLTLDYNLNRNWADGFWIRMRGAWIDQEEDFGGDDFFDFRIIINYDIEVIR